MNDNYSKKSPGHHSMMAPNSAPYENGRNRRLPHSPSGAANQFASSSNVSQLSSNQSFLHAEHVSSSFATHDSIHQFTNELLRMRQENASTITSYKNLEADAAKLKVAFRQNIKLLSEREAEQERLKKHLASQMATTEHLKDQLKSLQQDNKSLTEKCQNLQNKIHDSELSDEKSNLKLQQLNLNHASEIDKLRSQHATELLALQRTHDTTLQNLKTSLAAETEKNLNELKTAHQQQITGIEADKINLKMQIDHVSFLQESEADLSKQLKELRRDQETVKSAHEVEIGRFRAAVDASDDVLQQAEEKIVELTMQFKKKLSTIKSDNETKTSELSKKLDSASAETSRLHARISNLEGIEDKYRAEVSKCRKLEEDSKKYEERAEKYIEKNRLSAVNYAKLETRLQGAGAELERHESALKAVQQDNRTLEGTIDRMKNIMVQVGAVSSSVAVSDLTAEMSATETLLKAKEQATQALFEEKQKYSKLQRANEQLLQRIEESKGEKVKSEEENGRLTDLIMRLKTDLEDAKSKKSSTELPPGLILDSNKKDLVEKLTKAIATIEHLSAENGRLVDLNNRNARNRSRKNSTSSAIQRSSSARHNKFAMLENLGVQLTKNDLRKVVHRKDETARTEPSSASSVVTPRVSFRPQDRHALSPATTVPTPSVLDSFAAPGSDIWKPLNYKI